MNLPLDRGNNEDHNCLTVSYLLIDVITDEVSTWFSNRTYDRVNLLMSDIVKHIKHDDSDCVMAVQEDLDDRMNVQREEYEDFILTSNGKRDKSRENARKQSSTKKTITSESQSSSEYRDEDIASQGVNKSAPNRNDVQDESTVNHNEINSTAGSGIISNKGNDADEQPAASHSTVRLSSPKLETKHFLMDDRVPVVEPNGALPQSEREHQNSVSTGVSVDEVLKINVPMELWNCGTSTNVAMEVWMDSLLLKPGHRAEMFLTHTILMRMHKDVHEYIAKQCLSDNVKSRRFDGDQVNVKQMNAALSFLHARSMENDLNERGWTCLPKCKFMEKPMNALDSFYRECAPEVRGKPVWEIIAQTEDESNEIEKLGERGTGRRMASRFGVMELLEESRGKEWKHRAQIDVYIGILVQALGLGTRTDGTWDLFMPKSGGRPLCTDPDTDDQQIHCDYGIDQNQVKEVVTQPGYFVMVAGKLGFTLWIAERSHVLRHNPGWKKGTVDVKQVFVEPYSTFVGRGDLFHAGDKYNEKYNRDGAIRYHVLLCPDDGEFFNEIQYLRGANINWIGLPD